MKLGQLNQIPQQLHFRSTGYINIKTHDETKRHVEQTTKTNNGTYFMWIGSYAVTITSVSTPLRRRFATYTCRTNRRIRPFMPSRNKIMTEQGQKLFTLTRFCASLPCFPLDIACNHTLVNEWKRGNIRANKRRASSEWNYHFSDSSCCNGRDVSERQSRRLNDLW